MARAHLHIWQHSRAMVQLHPDLLLADGARHLEHQQRLALRARRTYTQV